MAKRKPPKGPKREQNAPARRAAPPRRAATPGPSRGPARAQAPARGRERKGGARTVWLYGAHAVLAALENPRRRHRRLLLSPEAARRHGARIEALRSAGRSLPEPEAAAREQIETLLGPESVHQGLALEAAPLAAPDLEAVLAEALARRGENAPTRGAPRDAPRPLVLVLDQVTDPHNVGAILRSAAAFGAAAVVVPGHNAAPESGVLAKAASGALEVVPYIEVTNLARALAQMKAAGFWSLGLAGEAERPLAEADPGGPLALVLGAEGSGLRRLTRESCDLLARLPTRPPLGSLNVSNAAAVALYAVSTK